MSTKVLHFWLLVGLSKFDRWQHERLFRRAVAADASGDFVRGDKLLAKARRLRAKNAARHGQRQQIMEALA